ncbi:hypothetical protein Chor_002480 [Crotalus horridus]
MLVERSADYGQTWKVYRYFAQNCAASFPDIPSKPAEAVGDLVCDSKYSDIEPSTEGEVIFKVLDPSFEIENVYDPYIQELVAFTNLRINFTKLHVLGDTLLGEKKRNLLENYYYALYEMVVRGSCMCNGHARYCGPGENLRGDVFHQPGMLVTAIRKALCKTGCARVIPILSSEPLLASVFASPTLKESIEGYWGLGSHAYGCSPCDCDIGGAYNNSCAPTDGQCDCRPHVVGRHCSEPAVGYFFLPLDYYIYEAEDSTPLLGPLPLVQPTAMPRCDVYFQRRGYDFTIENGKIVLKKIKKNGIRKLTAGQNSVPFNRNPALNIVIKEVVPGKPVTWSGLGFVRVRNKAGLRFLINNIPFPMHFNIIIRYEPETSADWRATITVKSSGPVGSEHCTKQVALKEPQSLVLPSTRRIQLLSTPICLQPKTEYFVDVYFTKTSDPEPKSQFSILVDSNFATHRRECVGTARGLPPDLTVKGDRCDECSSGFYGNPRVAPSQCLPCSCNNNTDVADPESCNKDTGECQCSCEVGYAGRRCDICTENHYGIDCIEDLQVYVCTLKCHFWKKKTDKWIQYRAIQKVSHMFLQPGPLDQFPDLHRVIENLHKDVDNLSETLQKRKDLHCGMTYLQFQDFFNKIKNYYQITLAAEKRIQGAKSIIAYGGNVRSKVFALLNDLDVKENITLDQLRTFTVSEIEDLNEKVCGMPGNVSCAVAECGGALCHDRQGNKYCGDPNCDGAYPLSINAFRKAERTDLLLSNLINQTQGFQNKIKSIRKMTEDTKEKTLAIHGKLEKSKYQIETERESMKELIKRLRNFLLDAQGTSGAARPAQQPPESRDTMEGTKALTAPDEIITDLKEVDDTQRQTKDALATSNEKIEETVSKISEAATELQAFPEKQSKLTEEISSLKTKMETNRIQAADARSKAKEAQNQAAESNKEFANLKHEFSNLQGKFLTSGLTLQKLSWLKKEAEELAQETAQKAKRITALEKKIQDLNQIKQQKADQLKQLEDHVLAIKNEIAEESNRYAVCKS